MTKYEVTFHLNGTPHLIQVTAENRDQAFRRASMRTGVNINYLVVHAKVKEIAANPPRPRYTGRWDPHE